MLYLFRYWHIFLQNFERVRHDLVTENEALLLRVKEYMVRLFCLSVCMSLFCLLLCIEKGKDS